MDFLDCLWIEHILPKIRASNGQSENIQQWVVRLRIPLPADAKFVSHIRNLHNFHALNKQEAIRRMDEPQVLLEVCRTRLRLLLTKVPKHTYAIGLSLSHRYSIFDWPHIVCFFLPRVKQLANNLISNGLTKISAMTFLLHCLYVAHPRILGQTRIILIRYVRTCCTRDQTT